MSYRPAKPLFSGSNPDAASSEDRRVKPGCLTLFHFSVIIL